MATARSPRDGQGWSGRYGNRHRRHLDDGTTTGRLDLYVANYLSFDPEIYKLYYNPTSYPGPLATSRRRTCCYINNGDGTFSKRQRVVGHRGAASAQDHVRSPLDFNHDGKVDLYLCNDATRICSSSTDGTGIFTTQAMQRGVAVQRLGRGSWFDDRPPSATATAIRYRTSSSSRLGYGSLYMGSKQGDCLDRMMASGLGVLTAQ